MSRRLFLIGIFLVVVCVIYVACGPTITIDPPDKPIEINVNVRIDIYNHVAEVEEDIYGDYMEDEVEEAPDGSESLLRHMFMKSAYGDTDDEKYTAAKNRRKGRASKVIKYKNDGSLGENHNGGVSLIKSDKVKNDSAYKDKVKDLVEDENADREIMYEIDAKKRDVSVDVLKQETARYWRDKSKTGHWIEVKEEGKWVWKQK